MVYWIGPGCFCFFIVWVRHPELKSNHKSAGGRITHSSFVCSIVGAVPPWLQDDPLEGTSGTTAYTHIGPSLQDFLKHSKNRLDISSSHPPRFDCHRKCLLFSQRNKRSWESFHQTGLEPTLTTVHTLTPTGFPPLAECGTVADAGSPGNDNGNLGYTWTPDFICLSYAT